MVCNISYLILEDGISRYKTYRHCCCFFFACLFRLFCFVLLVCFAISPYSSQKAQYRWLHANVSFVKFYVWTPSTPLGLALVTHYRVSFTAFFSSSFHSVDNDGSLELNCFARSVSLDYFLLALVQYGRKILIAAFHPLIAKPWQEPLLHFLPSIALHIVYAVHARGFAFFLHHIIPWFLLRGTYRCF